MKDKYRKEKLQSRRKGQGFFKWLWIMLEKVKKWALPCTSGNWKSFPEAQLAIQLPSQKKKKKAIIYLFAYSFHTWKFNYK
jgi:hypothetical protein